METEPQPNSISKFKIKSCCVYVKTSILQNKLKLTIFVISEYVNYIDENVVSKILTLAKISEESDKELVLQY